MHPAPLSLKGRKLNDFICDPVKSFNFLTFARDDDLSAVCIVFFKKIFYNYFCWLLVFFVEMSCIYSKLLKV